MVNQSYYLYKVTTKYQFSVLSLVKAPVGIQLALASLMILAISLVTILTGLTIQMLKSLMVDQVVLNLKNGVIVQAIVPTVLARL